MPDMQRAGQFSGLPSFTQKDAVVSISGGAIRDRSIEMLCTADVAITRLYRTLLACVKQVREGQAPIRTCASTRGRRRSCC